jgi:GTP-binding protein
MDYVLPIYVSAKTGQRTDKILDYALRVLDNASRRISTGQLNDLMFDCVRANEPPSINGKRLKIKYATQSGTRPPIFVLFVNESALMHFSYKRYLENCIRKAFDFSGTPIKIVARESDEDE